jgi:transposase
MRAYRERGSKGLAAIPRRGRPHKLSHRQARVVLGWIRKSPTQFGFATELWTGQRVAQLIERRLGVHFHPNYVLEWLRQRNVTSQKPRRQPRERDERKIGQWLQERWPEIKKKSRTERLWS